MRGATGVYREPANGYWLPNAEPRAAAIEARLAAMPQAARYLHGGSDRGRQVADDALSVAG